MIYHYPTATAQGGFFHRVWVWLKKAFTDIVVHAASVAISITEQIKDGLNSDAAGFIAKVLDGLTHSGVPDHVLEFLRKIVPEVLAAELAVQALPLNPTEQDILDFENKLLAAFKVTDNKSKLYTTLAAQIYGIVMQTFAATPDVPPTWAEWVKAVEEAYQDYQNDLQTTP